MSTVAAAPSPVLASEKPEQPLYARMFWFVVGGGLSVLLNNGPFHYMRTHGGLPEWLALAISLCVVTIVFAVWNYFLNFRTKSGFKECQARYLTAVALCYALTYGLSMLGIKHLVNVPALQQWAATTSILKMGFGLSYLPALVVKFAPEAMVASSQITVAIFKFFLYHKWVYPQAK